MKLNEIELEELRGYINTGMIPVELDYVVHIGGHQIGITIKNYINAVKDMLNYDDKLDKAQKNIKELEQYKELAEIQLNVDREAFANLANKGGRRKVVCNDGLQEGWLLGWSHKSNDSNYFQAVGIVEMKDGKIETPWACDIKFEDWEDDIGDGDTDGTL